MGIRKTSSGFEVYDCEGYLRGTAKTPLDLWALVEKLLKDKALPVVRLPTPEQVTYEQFVRDTANAVANYVESKSPDAMSFIRTFVRVATVAKRRGAYD
jgi:hypothetical protein